MIDYWQDQKIDCKDYAIENTIKAENIHAENTRWVVIKRNGENHVIVIFEKNGYLYVADNDKLYRTRIPN